MNWTFILFSTAGLIYSMCVITDVRAMEDENFFDLVEILQRHERSPDYGAGLGGPLAAAPPPMDPPGNPGPPPPGPGPSIILPATPSSAQVDDRRCLECMCQVDSGCRNVKCQKEPKRFGGGRVCGFYKLSQKYFDKCGAPGRRPRENKRQAFTRCSQNKPCAAQCVLKFAVKNEDRSCLTTNNSNRCEMYARNHFGGPGGCRKDTTVPYWQRVKKCLDTKNTTLTKSGK